MDITVGQNSSKEQVALGNFRALQDQIYNAFGASEPMIPVLRCRNATQTSVVLEWDPIELATADLMSLSLYRNGQKAGNIPRPTQMTTTKISGLAVDSEYTFHLVLRTTAGTLSSDKVTVRTHKMTDLSGITITTGVLPSPAKENLARAVERIGAKIVDSVRIDTTHFVTTEGRGQAWEKAVETNIPVVRPEWVEACEKNGRILGVTKFYLDAMRPGPMSEEQQAPPSAPQAQPEPPARSSVSRPSESSKEEKRENPVEPKDEEKEPRKSGSSEEEEEEESEKAGKDQEGEKEDKDGAGEKPEQKYKQIEQKVRFEDQEEEQKVALHSKPAPADEKKGEDEASEQNGVEEAKDEAKNSSSEDSKDKPATTPPDGASFQEVEL